VDHSRLLSETTRAAIAILAAAGLVCAQPPAATPKFEVASIKACKGSVPGRGGNDRGRSGGRGSSPGRLDLPCLPVRFFIQLAYLIHGEGNGPIGAVLEGGPGWIDSERYQISAKAEFPATRETMNGPMLRALLEERFQLKIHRESREIPIYALTVAKSGLKLLAPGDPTCTEPDLLGKTIDGRSFLPLNCGKIQRSNEASCTDIDPAEWSRASGQKPPCGLPRMMQSQNRNLSDLPGATMAQFARGISAGRPVVDQTGLTDKFDFHLEYAPQSASAADDAAAAPSVFSALAELGLKLEPARGPRDFLVIDHVERPSEN
jgi:uncharacterized protein (TIGR03435 family)